MRAVIITLTLLLFSIRIFGQTNVVYYSYDSVGNRIQRDTLAAVATVLHAEELQCELDTINNPQYTAILGEVVISSRGTSPKPIARHSLMGKIKPVKSQILHKEEHLSARYLNANDTFVK